MDVWGLNYMVFWKHWKKECTVNGRWGDEDYDSNCWCVLPSCFPKVKCQFAVDAYM